MNAHTKKISVLLLSIGILFIPGCYYDNEEELYPTETSNCNTTEVSYSQGVLPILEENCLGCHDTQSPAAGISLEGYENVFVEVESGRLEGSITHSAGFEPMPRNANKLPDCDIQTIQAWIAQGAANN